MAVKLRGGLGNQLFQYAAGRHLARLRDAGLELDISAYVGPRPPHGVLPPRPYGLRHFRIQARETTQRRALLERRIVQQPTFGYMHDFEDLPAAVYLDGYWQSEKYFLGSADVIRRELTPRSPEDVPARARSLRDSGTVVAVNVRRGDYLELATKHPPVSLSYIHTAMAEFDSRHDFLVVSDDIAWCQRNITGDRVQFSTGLSDIQNFWLMVHCSHHIIANSTFCWWAAWLAASPDQRVVAPERWFGPDYAHLDTSDLHPQGWTILPG